MEKAASWQKLTNAHAKALSLLLPGLQPRMQPELRSEAAQMHYLPIPPARVLESNLAPQQEDGHIQVFSHHFFSWTLVSHAWWSDKAMLLGRALPGSSCWAPYLSLLHFHVSMRMEMI